MWNLRERLKKQEEEKQKRPRIPPLALRAKKGNARADVQSSEKVQRWIQKKSTHSGHLFANEQTPQKIISRPYCKSSRLT
jgi:hypothetical protein